MEILLLLGFMLLVITLLGHGIWVLLRWFIRSLAGKSNSATPTHPESSRRCSNCDAEISRQTVFCGKCGVQQTTPIVAERLKDLAATERQLERFFRAGAIEGEVYENLKQRIQAERTRLQNRAGQPASASKPAAAPTPPAPVTAPTTDQQPIAPPSVVVTETASITVETNITMSAAEQVFTSGRKIPSVEHVWQTASSSAPPPPPPQVEPRRHFSEVLAAFMEESNIRWGEIIGGLLIIGCSTALVVSLWAQISAIPVLKFLIFTTVTAALFGVGFYTEHRWKLPTTSRGILTTATLLVPLNFLAIAAVSSSTLPHAPLVIASELVAPAMFLCLVYFAGRVITPKWPHLLAAGVLGSSVGQLLIRHFATPDYSPGLLLALGGFPIVCYVGVAGWMLWIALADSEIDESESIAIFTSLGALTFATVLPFGLLLHKSGPVSMSMMFLAPLVALAGMPMLFSGTLLWKRVNDKELAATRVAGTSIALMGTIVVLSGMILAWPNPASIVPAALLNFAVLTILAVLLEMPLAHLLAAVCLSLGYVVLYLVLTGEVPWQNLRVVSLLQIANSIRSGEALTHLFIPFAVASIWLSRKKRQNDGFSYLLATCFVAVVSLFFLSWYGFNVTGDPHHVWIYFLFYALGAFVLAEHSRWQIFAWVGSALLLVAGYQALGPWLSTPFPWQTAFLIHASLCALAAVVAFERRERVARFFTAVLNKSALITSFVTLLFLLQANTWETTSMQAERMFWLAGIWLVLLWLNRDWKLFTVFQIALAATLVLAIKATLQQYEWYAYLPHAFLHPVALQIQGTALVLLSLIWCSLRFGVAWRVASAESTASGSGNDWLSAAKRLLESDFAFDRLILWIVLFGFSLLVVYGAASGVKQELSALGSRTAAWDIVGFPHQYALGLGSWILLGLLVIAMLVNLWQRRQAIYVLGALLALVLACPLLAGLWETQIATASAWRWFSALFLALASLVFWYRERLSASNFGLTMTSGVTGFGGHRQAEAYRTARRLLLITTLVPLLVLTVYPALRAIYYLPVHGPSGGIFYALADRISYSLPLVLTAVVLVGYAVRGRLAGYAFSAGLFLNLAVTIVYLLSVVAVHGSMDRVVLVRVIELNTIVAALYAIVWLSMRERWRARLSAGEIKRVERLFEIQIGMAVLGLVSILAPMVANRIIRPLWVGAGTLAVGGIYGWLAFLLTVVAAAWFLKSFGKALSADMLCGALVGLSALIAASAGAQVSTGLMAYRVLVLSLGGAAWLMCLSRSLPTLLEKNPARQRIIGIKLGADWPWNTTLFASVLGVSVVVLALRVIPEAPADAWWTIIAVLAMSALAAALNWQTLRDEFLFAAGLLVHVAVVAWWWAYRSDFLSSANFFWVNIAAGCTAGILWLWLQLRARRLKGSKGKEVAFHHFAALGSLVVMSVVLFTLYLAYVNNRHLGSGISFGWGWLALVSLAALMFACLWDQLAKYAVASLHLIGLIAVLLGLLQAELSLRHLAWAIMMALAIYSLLVGLLWRRRAVLIEWASQLKIPPRFDPANGESRWLVIFTAGQVFAAILLAYGIELLFSEWVLRMTAAAAVATLALAVMLVAQGASRSVWRKAAFAVLVIGAVFFGWAWLQPGSSGTWLNRAVILMVEMFAIVGVLGLELDKALRREPEWTKAVRECAPWLTVAGIVALVFVLATEVFYQLEFGAVRVNPLALGTVGVTLLVAIASCIFFALSPAHDPLSLTEKRRRNYVYVAEVLLALFFMHLRLTMPWLFTGFFERYWPLVVVAIAYLGVTASEMLRRRGVFVLAHPIERTGVFLPLLPVLGFWLTKPDVDYSMLLFIVGGLYGLVAILRRSFLFGMLAVLAGNGGLWYLWHRTVDYGFLEHPQLWLIPAAVSVLVATHLNRKDFSEDQIIGIRYLALITIYVSSTADIFINGVARSPWLPLILAALSLAGIFGGMLLRIRAFLLLGSVFLLLAITTMIYYASANFGWTWLWWAAGVIAGAMIFFIGAMFERKREEMLRVVEGLKEWER
jgi:hypothetical protein